MVLLLLPPAVVPVENKMSGEAEAKVPAPFTWQCCRVLFWASLMNRTGDPAAPAAVLAMVRSVATVAPLTVAPEPPGRPSMTRYLPPLRLKVAVVLALVMLRLFAPAAGRTVTVLVDDAPKI
jgi:hypothetical protein